MAQSKAPEHTTRLLFLAYLYIDHNIILLISLPFTLPPFFSSVFLLFFQFAPTRLGWWRAGLMLRQASRGPGSKIASLTTSKVRFTATAALTTAPAHLMHGPSACVPFLGRKSRYCRADCTKYLLCSRIPFSVAFIGLAPFHVFCVHFNRGARMLTITCLSCCILCAPLGTFPC